MIRSALIMSLAMSFSSSAEPLNKSVQSIERHKDHLERFYQDLHKFPELSGEEKATAAKVAAEFRALGLEVIEGVGGHGVVGILRNGEGPTSIVRSELDGLPVQEESKIAYKSQVDGKMHACGHDFHMASLLGTAYVMKDTKADWKGTLLFIAQPAEEIGKGARSMVNDDQFKKLPKANQALALHTAGQLKKGSIGVTPGYVMAAVDAVDVSFKGRGTHGAMPETGVDPFIQSAEFILKLQTLLGREKLATQPAVISVGTLHGGTKRNIIPGEVKIGITVRTYDPEVREMLKKRIRELAFGIARTNSAPEPIVDVRSESDATYNDPALTAKLSAVMKKELGADHVVELKPSMAGEDFGRFGEALKVPSFFFAVGERDEKDPTITNHSPKFAPDFRKTAPVAIRAMTSALMALHRTQ